MDHLQVTFCIRDWCTKERNRWTKRESHLHRATSRPRSSEASRHPNMSLPLALAQRLRPQKMPCLSSNKKQKGDFRMDVAWVPSFCGVKKRSSEVVGTSMAFCHASRCFSLAFQPPAWFGLLLSPAGREIHVRDHWKPGHLGLL